MKRFLLLNIFATACFITFSAQALPLPRPGMSRKTLPPTFTADYNFEGIIALSNCSGALVQLENGRDTDKGLILTNGHCLEFGMPKPGQFVYGRTSSRSFRLFDADTNIASQVNATQVIYSTMTKTDMTLYKLNETYGEIKAKFGVNPLSLSSLRPSEKDPIEVVSGYWKLGYRCQIEAFVNKLSEAGWISEDSIRYTRPGCEVIGGTSGSPVIRAGTRVVIGVNNTGNEDGEKCTLNNPCEIDSAGKISAQKGFTYGQQTYWIYTCLNQYSEFDLSVPGCLLPH